MTLATTTLTRMPMSTCRFEASASVSLSCDATRSARSLSRRSCMRSSSSATNLSCISGSSPSHCWRRPTPSALGRVAYRCGDVAAEHGDPLALTEQQFGGLVGPLPDLGEVVDGGLGVPWDLAHVAHKLVLLGVGVCLE